MHTYTHTRARTQTHTHASPKVAAALSREAQEAAAFEAMLVAASSTGASAPPSADMRSTRQGACPDAWGNVGEGFDIGVCLQEEEEYEARLAAVL